MCSFTRSFPRIARQLNYKREFLNKISARVDVPGFPYEAFDNTGKLIKPWSILHLVESVRVFTFWGNVSLSSTEESLLDMQNILKNHFMFIVGANIKIEKDFHKPETPKFPLYMKTGLKHVGKTSKTLYYDLYHAGTDQLYFACDIIDVLVSESNRKSVSYPEWWLEKYANTVTAQKPPPRAEPMSSGQVLSTGVRVWASDTDTHKHVNWATYLRYCYESFYDHVINQAYGNVDKHNLDAGIQTVNLIYSREANYGNNLAVLSWDSSVSSKTVNFKVMRGSDICCHCNLTLF